MKNLFSLAMIGLILITACAKAEKTESAVEKEETSAVNENDIEVVEVEPANGEDTRTLIDPGALPLAAQSQDMDELTSLLDQGADVNSTDASGATALHWAANKNNYDMAVLLIEKGADPDIKDSSFGATPINWAAFDGSLDIVMLLAESGADINTQNMWGNTPLHNAITQNDIAMVEYLIGQGADMTVMNNNGETPFVLAQSLANPDVLRLLK